MKVAKMARRMARAIPLPGRRLKLSIFFSLCVLVTTGQAASVIVISPHNSSIRHEFGEAFGRWHESNFRSPAKVEWRNVGGTSDAVRFVLSEFEAKPDGIGIDCFFGGGPEPCLRLAERNLAEPHRLPDEILAGIPRVANGVEIYDAQFRWYGAALSSFGVLRNSRVVERLKLPDVLRWEELSSPRLMGWVAAGDPRRSGTMSNMYEAYLQAHGWEKGWRLLTRIAGNVAQFDRLSSSTAKQVTLGEAAYGFAIDFYAFTQIAAAGRDNMAFVLPDDFTAISPDGIAILRGAPNALTVRRFVEFVMGEFGQKLWHLPRGHPEGPRRFSIERMSVRSDLYDRYQDVSNIAFSPFQLESGFHYDARLAQSRRDVMSSLFGAILIDTHSELRTAWREVILRGVREGDLREFGSVPISEDEASELGAGLWQDAAFRTRQRIEWQRWAQRKFQRLAERE